MKEVKSPKKPLIYYYGIALLLVLLFNLVVAPFLTRAAVEEVDYGTFMKMTEDEEYRHRGNRRFGNSFHR